MPTTLNRQAYLNMVVEDLDWLREQPNTLERRHIETILEWIIRENQEQTGEEDARKEVKAKDFTDRY